MDYPIAAAPHPARRAIAGNAAFSSR